MDRRPLPRLRYRRRQLAGPVAARPAADAQRTILERITDGFFSLDRDWRFTYINASAEPLLRRDRAELVGRVIWEAYPDVVGTIFEEQYRHAVAAQTPVSFEAPYEPLDTWFAVRAYPEPTGLSVYFHDIGERKRVEVKLEQRVAERAAELAAANVALAAEVQERQEAEARTQAGEDLLRAVGKMARIGGYEVDVATAMPTFSEEVQHIHELPPGVTPTLEEAFSFFPLPARRVLEAAFEAAVRDGTAYDLELPFITATGRWRWVRTQGQADMVDGKVTRVRGAFQDITERKRAELALSESEERYRRLFEASMEAIVLADDQGLYLDANEAAAALFGIPREQLIGISSDDLRDDNGPETAERHRRYLVSGRDAGEFPFTRPDGSQRVAQYTAVRLGVNLHQSILRDITVEREAASRLRVSLAEKEVLLKEIHHRVKNNLQVVASMLRLQSEHIGDPRVRELFLDSQRRVRAMALVHERLYQAPDLARIDLAAYVRTLAADLLRAYRIAAGAVTVRTEISLAGIDVDQAVALGLILNELIANCLKHAFPQGRTGVIIIGAARSPTGDLILRVSDDGVGLPADLDPAHSPTMGLQIVHALATQVGGTIAWRRIPGTAVTLTISE